MATSISEDDNRYHDASHSETLLTGLSHLRGEGSLCDVELHAGKAACFRAHRAVLSACSSYFHAMFAGRMREAQQESVHILGIEPDVFKLLLDYMYTGYLSVEVDNVQDILSSADMLQLPGVVSICCSYLRGQLHPSNCLGVLRFARSHACPDLADTCLAFACAYFAQVTRAEEFLEAGVDEVMSLLESEDLRVDNEFEVFESAVRWILHLPSERRKVLIRVLEPVRFTIISRHQLFDLIGKCPDLSLRVALAKLLERFNPEKAPSVASAGRRSPFNSVSRPRAKAGKHLVIVGGYRRNPGDRFGDTETLDSVLQLNTFTQRWTAMPSLQQPRHGHDVAFLNGALYTIGGECDALINNGVETLDPALERWSDAPALMTARCGHGVCTVDGIIYVLGGIEGSTLLKCIERYDEGRGRWCVAGRMTDGRSYFAIAEVEGLIYLAGGNMDPSGGELRSVESYNPVTAEWNCLANMKHRRSHCGMGVLGDHLYVVGGVTQSGSVLSSVERYSISENEWSSIKHMSVPRADVCVGTANGMLYVIGGRSPGRTNRAPETLDSVECYDPRTASWIDMGRMPSSRCEAALAVL